MISGIFHSGSGLGNQLHRYVATRVLALDKGYDFSMVAPENFKGSSFMKLDMGIKKNIPYMTEQQTGHVVAQNYLPLWEEKTNYYNPEFNFVEDNTIIDGEFQDERYFGRRLYEIDQWLDVDFINTPNDVCIINFRGGEYALYPDLFLDMDYWHTAIMKMKCLDFEMKFEVHTDDKELASKYFPDFPIIQNMEINWRSLRYARYAIVSNSSFAILPRLFAQTRVLGAVTIAPRYWARHNTKEWSRPDNYYKSFQYV